MAFITLEKLQIRSQMSDLSAKIIGCVGKLSTKKVNSSTEERMIYVKKLKKYKSDFMQSSRDLENINYSNMNEDFEYQFLKIKESSEEISSKIVKQIEENRNAGLYCETFLEKIKTLEANKANNLIKFQQNKHYRQNQRSIKEMFRVKR